MDTKNNKLVYLVIAVICMITFYPILKADFMGYDDPYYVLENQYIKHFSFENLKGIFTGKAIDLYIPITMLFYLIEYTVFGSGAHVFHIFSLLLHILNTILLLNLLGRLGVKDTSLRYLLLLFFALNPLVCESVCWIAEQKDLLYTSFFFLSAMQFLDYRNSGSKKHLLLSLLLFVLACLSKPMAVSLPALFLIYLVYTEQKINVRKWLYVGPFILLSALFSLLAMYSIKHAAEYKIPEYAFAERSMLLLSELGYYFFKPFLPIHQQLINAFPVKGTVIENRGIMAFAALGALLLIYLIYNFAKKRNRLSTTLLFTWLIFLLPILQIFPNTHSYVSERYFYISIIFPVAIFYTGIKKITWLNQQISFFILLMMFVAMSFKRSGYWLNTKTMFEQELRVDAEDARALNNLGYYYNSIQDYQQAKTMLHKAISLDRHNAVYLNNYGWTMSGINLTDSAITTFKMALHEQPDFIKALNNLGICYSYQRDWKNAYDAFSKAYGLNHKDPETLYNLGLYYLSVGEQIKGKQLMRDALELGNTAAQKYAY